MEDFGLEMKLILMRLSLAPGRESFCCASGGASGRAFAWGACLFCWRAAQCSV